MVMTGVSSQLVGSWTLTEFSRSLEGGPWLRAPLARGRLLYDSSGAMAVVLAIDDPEADGPRPPSSFVAYTGTWEVVGDDTVRHLLEVSAHQPWESTYQDRTCSIAGDDLELRSEPLRTGAGETIFRYRWRRVMTARPSE